ncbi:MAG: ABC transporter substrate-binding protein [Chloroflexi bacterium]|nr:ABC transporter substrate-binding protein [Chloroflexota bacterium]
MKKKFVWLVVSGWMVVALLLSACAPAVVEEEKVAPREEVVTPKEEVVPREVVVPKEESNFIKWTGTKLDGTVVEKMLEKPKYGGRLRLLRDAAPFHDWSTGAIFRTGEDNKESVRVHSEELLIGDLKRGPSGTGEWTGVHSVYLEPDLMVGNLVESWEIQPDILKFKIRKGVHWQDKPPMNGAELTAADVAFNFVYFWAHKDARYPSSYPYISNLKNPQESIYVDPADPRTVVFKTAPGQLPVLWELLGSWSPVLYGAAFGPIEQAVAKEGYGDWKGVVGTGAFILTDWLPDSVIKYTRNPNYWKRDPFFPENQLPYVDSVEFLVIPDWSTQQAALRTGKIDILDDLAWEQGELFLKSNPALKYITKFSRSSPVIDVRNDQKPWSDVRVRRAMMMAIDHDAIVKDLYDGHAEKFYWQPLPVPELADYYVPLEEMPQDVQMLFEYHPDKARELLAEAGYPDGFKTTILINQVEQEYIDLAIIVKEDWAKVGVDLKIDIREPAVFTSLWRRRSYEAIVRGHPLGGMQTRMTFSMPGQLFNSAMVNEPFIIEYQAKLMGYYFDRPKRIQTMREATPELHRLAPFILLPWSKAYKFWQPWVKGYHGENSVFKYLTELNEPAREYLWIDQELKAAMGH